ncbi:esterase-like activity of phytase family protein [Neotabrizicola sp. VNH66]|uniref:esterase-like activity of phytase family protein n=1 Tax=Neotabrizicola sp. VNH66 TaxID=3400918 RepID=UPI003C075591
MSFRRRGLTSALALSAAAGAALPASAEAVFNRIASFATPLNMAEGEDKSRASSAEIIAANEDGTLLIYSDSPLGVIGLIDITDPKSPQPLGNIDVGGEPTTTQIIGNFAYAAVNTSESYANPSGKLVTIDLSTRAVVGECDLGGQPDSVARAKDGSFLAIAIENERDEDVNDGALPQMPAGYLVKLPVAEGAADCAALQKIDVTGLAAYGAEDPEPEYVDVNTAGEIVLTMQENNHIVVVGADGAISANFSAGTVDLDGIDTKKDGKLDFTGSMQGVTREPDGVKWIGTDHFVTANEGDWEGGSRGFTIWAKDGTVVYESGASLEREIAALGHYPDKRNKKGVEIESVEVAQFGGDTLLFVVSERASVVAVYNINDPAAPELLQILPSGISPEGIVAIPSRNLLVTANEVDLREDGGAPAHVMIFERAEGTAAYPTLTSAGTDPLVGWVALSGLAADPVEAGKLYAVSDSFLSGQPSIYTIDATQTPAKITGATVVTRGKDAAQKLDLEGIAADGEGGFWLANEGDAAKLVPHAVLHVDADGKIDQEIGLPVELLSGQKRFGLEGISVAGNTLWMAVQREWGDDPKGMVKLLAYDLEAEEWSAVHYPLETPTDGAWMGLSELTIAGDWMYIVERDNQIADRAAVKKLYRVKMADLAPAKLGETLPVVVKEEVRDFIPDLKVTNGYVLDKVEGFTIDASGTGYVVTDNDGVDDSSGETLFWSIGKVE